MDTLGVTVGLTLDFTFVGLTLGVAEGLAVGEGRTVGEGVGILVTVGVKLPLI